MSAPTTAGHGRAGTLWDGRFRCAPVEPGAALLDLLVWIDGQAGETSHTSAALRLAGHPDALLGHPPEFWALGNTPFEREAAYRRRLADGTGAEQARRWQQAALGGWAIGSAAFGTELALRTQRPVPPAPAGPPKEDIQPGRWHTTCMTGTSTVRGSRPKDCPCFFNLESAAI